MAAAPDFSYYSQLALCSQSGTCPWKENSTLQKPLHPVPFWEATNFSFLPVFTLISLNKALLLLFLHLAIVGNYLLTSC